MGFRFEFFDTRRILMLHGEDGPSASDWHGYLDELRARDVTTLGLLAFTAGGVPNPAQRRELNELLEGRRFPRAIVHTSPLVRGVVAAVSWFAPGVQAFRPEEWASAAQHIGFAPGDLASLASRLRRLNAELTEPIHWLDEALGAGPPRRATAGSGPWCPPPPASASLPAGARTSSGDRT